MFRWRSPRRGHRGQALVEFALLSPVLMLLLVGVVDLGRALYYQVQTASAARDAARMMVLNASTSGLGGYPNTASTPDQSVCGLVQQDLNGTFSVTCQDAPSAPPYASGSYTAPAAGNALVLLYPSNSCRTSPSTTSCPNGIANNVDVYATVIYTFNPVIPFSPQVLGNITLQTSFEMRADW